MSVDHLDRAGGPPPGAPPQEPDRSGGGRPPRRRLLRGAALATALVLVLGTAVALAGGPRRAVEAVSADPALAQSDRTMLRDLWLGYTDDFLEEGSRRTVDPVDGGITTSEGQSYTMMRAVWSDDQQTFDDSWQWTKDNLQRPDGLLSWRFGPLTDDPDGAYGVQTDRGGQNTASDADVDVAYALLMAHSRWKDDAYLYDALPLVSAIWQAEVVEVAGRPVLVANDLERNDATSVLVNPSYFAPYAYRAFAHVDPEHDWDGLVDSTYTVLEQLSTEQIGDGPEAAGAGLVPDWVRLDRQTGQALPADLAATSGGSGTDFGYEGLRLPWRLSLDHLWHGEPRALALLQQQAPVLAAARNDAGELPAVYQRDGQRAVDYTSVAMAGGAIGALDAADPRAADEVYRTQLRPQYDADLRRTPERLGYYDANWLWFGTALHLGALPNLTTSPGSDVP